ncbi:MAG: signal peptidase I [Candidatus Thorarchaeota archaeon]|nr:signal peptidase I [Candidatus Thorarchaeota archaeon]
MRFKEILRWNERSEPWRLAVSLAIVLFVTLSGYTIFALAMGSSTPLVVVTSGSMEQTLYRGDLLAIQKRSEDQIAIDDIIVFRADWHPGTPIVHRAVAIYEDENGGRLFETKGDNNYAEDKGNRTIDDILGVVIFTILLVGHLSLFLQTDTSKIIAFAFLALLLTIPEIYERMKKRFNR